MVWLDTGYTYKKTLTIDHTKVSTSDQSNFPVLVLRTDADLATVANGGKVQHGSGYDIRFSNAAENAWLDHEIESYTATTGAIVMHVEIPDLSSSVDTVIYCYFGNTSISSSQENVNGTWNSSFKGVWHMKAASGSNESDSTASGATLTQNNSPASVSGKVGNARSFNGTTQYFSSADTDLNITGDKTVEMLINTNSFAQSGINRRCVHNNIDNSNGYQLTLWDGNGAGGGFVWAVDEAATQYIMSNNLAGSGYSTGTWYYVGASYVSSSHTLMLVIDATQRTDDGGASGWGLASTGFNIGRRTDSSGYVDGIQDETRISNVARSVGWRITTANSLLSPSTFYSVGALQTQPASNRSGIIYSDNLR